MKILKIISISLLILFVIVFAGVFIFLQTLDINKYLPSVTQRLSHIIHRQVHIEHAGLGIHLPLTVSLDLQNLAVSDDPLFSPRNFLVVDKIHLGLDVMPLLLKREVHVSAVKIIAPRVSVIRLNNGQINIQTMIANADGSITDGTMPSSAGISPSSSTAFLNKTSGPPSAINLPSVFIKSVAIDHAQISFEDQNSLLPLHISIQDINGRMDNFSLTEPFVVTFNAHTASGEIDLKIDIQKLLTTPHYDFQLRVKNVHIEDCLDESHWPALLKGQLVGVLNGSGQGFELQMMQENFKGQGEFFLNHARLEKLNILKSILRKLDFIPGLSAQIEEALSSVVKDKLGSDTTVLDKVQTRIRMRDKTFFVDEVQVESNIFSLIAKGTVKFDLATDINVQTYLAADLSKELVGFVKPLKGLLDAQGRLYIPGKITGNGTTFVYQPEVGTISKKVVMEEGAQQINKQLQKVLNKNPVVNDILNAVLGGGQGQETSNSQTTTNSEAQENQPTNTSDQNQEQPTRKLINNVLKNILR